MPRFSRWVRSTVLRRTTVEDDDLFALVTDSPLGAAVSYADLSAQISAGAGAVDSVNGQTGAVVLNAINVGADPTGSAGAVNTALNAHVTDTSDAHDASAVSFVPTGGIASTNVQDAIPEVVSNLVGFGAASYAPITHAATHADGGADEVALNASQITAGELAEARIPATITRDTELTAGLATRLPAAGVSADADNGVLLGTDDLIYFDGIKVRGKLVAGQWQPLDAGEDPPSPPPGISYWAQRPPP